MQSTTIAKTANGEHGGSIALDHNEGKVYELGGRRIGDITDNATQERHLSALAAGKRFNADGELVKLDIGPADISIGGTKTTFVVEPDSQDFIADIVSEPVLVKNERGSWFGQSTNDTTPQLVAVGDAYGGQPAVVTPNFAATTYACDGFAVACQVGEQVRRNADFDILAAGARRNIEALQLNREVRVATLLTTAASWNTNNTATLAAGAKWNGGASSDPLADVQARLDATWLPATHLIIPERLQPFVALQTKFANLLMAGLSFPTLLFARAKTLASGNPTPVWSSDVVAIRRAASREGLCTSRTLRWLGVGPADRVVDGFYVREYRLAGTGSRGTSGVVVLHSDAEIFVSNKLGGCLKAAWQ